MTEQPPLMKIDKIFNVRVYGILIEDEAVLVSDEIHFDRMITKFPGGGLEFGEGTTDCLIREFKEELNIDIAIISHFYTVDFFQPNAFNPKQQVISIYYLVKTLGEVKIEVTTTPFQFKENINGSQVFRWLQKQELNSDAFTFPIDKRVAGLLSEQFDGIKN